MLGTKPWYLIIMMLVQLGAIAWKPGNLCNYLQAFQKPIKWIQNQENELFKISSLFYAHTHVIISSTYIKNIKYRS